LAEQFGAHIVDLSAGAEPVAAAQAWTGERGVDGVIITASAKTDAIVHQAAESCRKRGRIVLVGVVGLNLRRSDFYEKELTFQVSCSYGPGRYDEAYEQAGHDYPLSYVRWTEGRNFEAVLSAMAEGGLDVRPLITHRHAFGDALKAYEAIENDPSALGVILEYAGSADRSTAVQVVQKPAAAAGQAVVGVIGAGNFATAVLLPALAKTSARIAYVADLDGAAARHAAAKYGGEQAVTDYRRILEDDRVGAVFVVTGHHTHARFVCEALQAGKHVFTEKPLALDESQLQQVESCVLDRPGKILMVGFNRRFSEHTQKIKSLLGARTGPLCMTMTVNAGAIPADHWTQDPQKGGGRIIGEGCHFIDLLSFLADCPVATVGAARVGTGPAVRDDKMAIVLTFPDGSVGTINYFANGCKRYPKEKLDVFFEGKVLHLDNFRLTRGFGLRGFSKFKTLRQDKGHTAEIAAFVGRVAAGGDPLIPYDRLANVTRASFGAVRSAAEHEMVRLDEIIVGDDVILPSATSTNIETQCPAK